MVANHNLVRRSPARRVTARSGPQLQHVAQGVHLLQLGIVNVVFIADVRSGRWLLVDAGLVGTAHTIFRATETLFGQGARPDGILLTHGHFDHVGGLRELAERWDAPVYAHRLEAPFLTGRSKYPPPDPTVGGGLMARSSPMFPRGPIDVSDRLILLDENGDGTGPVPNMPDWRWVHTPGHTPGHVSLFREQDRTLVAGDAFVTTKQESAVAVFHQKLEIHGPPAYFTPDWGAAADSVRRLLALRPNAAATGHGLPMRGPLMLRQLAGLAGHFEDMAVPRHGRYVGRPAAFDESGTIAVPEPVNDPVPKVLIAAGLAVAGLGLLLAAANRRH